MSFNQLIDAAFSTLCFVIIVVTVTVLEALDIHMEDA